MGKGIKITKAKSKTDYQHIDREMRKKGYMSLDALKMTGVHNFSLGDRDTSEAQASAMAGCMGSGSLSSGPLSKVAFSFDSRDAKPLPLTDKNGRPLGNGYIPWGPADNIPALIYSLAKALPYTASPLKYLADLATGLGPRLMYRFPDGELVEYRDAGARLLDELEALEAEYESRSQEDSDGDASLLVNILGEKKQQDKEPPRLKRAREAYNEWKRTWEGEDILDNPEEENEALHSYTHIPGAREFLEQNDMALHCSQCMQDDVLFDMYFPMVGLEQGRKGQPWGHPKIVSVDSLSIINGVRYEVMNEFRFINHIYFSDQWRTKGLLGVTTVSPDSNKVVMFPTAMPKRRQQDMEYIVKQNQRRSPSGRPTWISWPVFYGNKNYYQQPAWWSIFLAKFYDFASTIAYDKAKQRENITSWGKVFYISLDYLDSVFSDEGYQGNPEKQQEFIDELEQSMEDFLQHRENHGKMMRQWMWTGQDGKDHHNVEIVDIAETSKDVTTAGKEELELATSPIFLALGVDPRLVGVPMVAASNGGTALREMHLLKQQQLNVKQKGYERFLDSVAHWNNWYNAEWHIKQQTLTTLDNSKTGTVETIAGEGA